MIVNASLPRSISTSMIPASPSRTSFTPWGQVNHVAPLRLFNIPRTRIVILAVVLSVSSCPVDRPLSGGATRKETTHSAVIGTLKEKTNSAVNNHARILMKVIIRPVPWYGVKKIWNSLRFTPVWCVLPQFGVFCVFRRETGVTPVLCTPTGLDP